jgi:hypothetical protein
VSHNLPNLPLIRSAFYVDSASADPTLASLSVAPKLLVDPEGNMSSGISWRQVLGEAHTGFYDVFIILTLVGNAVKGRMSRGSIDPDSDLLDLLKVEAEANLIIDHS